MALRGATRSAWPERRNRIKERERRSVAPGRGIVGRTWPQRRPPPSERAEVQIRRALAIFGAGGHGNVVADGAAAAGWQEIVFFDDAYPARTETGIWPILGRGSDLVQRAAAFDAVLVGVGDNAARLHWHRQLQQAGACLATVVHPFAWISPHARLGPGSVVMAGAVVNFAASIAESAIINTGATIDHHCSLAPAVHVAPGANLSGGVRVGTRSWIGIGAAIRQQVTIGADCMIGAGAVVVADVADGLTLVGNPARPLQNRASC